ncbi:MAG TPA: ferritin-like domain-containing protein [Planctomycetaceae bacterium]|nr:ferritin-like domain-containing protein [Planctomycetaceae bacterium]
MLSIIEVDPAEAVLPASVTDWNSADWSRHFEHRAQTRPPLPFARGVHLTNDEQRDLLPSIAIFQRGESGEGRHFLRVAAVHAQHVGDAGYVTALQQFIAEENMHAAMLGEYLDAYQFPRLTGEWTDNGFRRLRHLAGLETAITVLVTAEVIAMVYYAALRKASRCPVLKELCEQVLDDEVFHLHFQGQRLGILQRRRGRLGRCVSSVVFTVLLDAAGRLVWGTHRAVFARAEMSFAEYQHRLHRHGTMFQEIVRGGQLGVGNGQ